ncbi:hypothetical protein [uncultured Tateyamaria sp.]|uniref:hypothetical protein n=1 Tax=uncultured Tateyamaria sp. TaxID=455651 RepID=UPI00260AE5EC|nr:hypothetical protein [uncultured Tateyamaria sp.]
MKALITATTLALGIAMPAHAFDRQMTAALRLCHDYLWDVPKYADLPNAAISVFPGIFDDQSIVVFWNVYWDEPTTRAAGNCTIIDGALEGFEDYLAQE